MGKKRYAPDEVMRAVSLVAAGGMMDWLHLAGQFHEGHKI